MISHEHRCIFVHIPRTAGSSIEHWIVGNNWWNIERESKHLLASQAKRLYAEYWDEYFKFSFVRNPIDRMISCFSHADYFGLKYSPKSGLSFDGYHERFGLDIIIENDYRFSDRRDLLSENHQRQSVFGNILDEELDFIGKFESLESDLKRVQRAIGKKASFNAYLSKWKDRERANIIACSADREHIEGIFKRDLERFSLSC